VVRRIDSEESHEIQIRKKERKKERKNERKKKKERKNSTYVRSPQRLVGPIRLQLCRVHEVARQDRLLDERDLALRRLQSGRAILLQVFDQLVPKNKNTNPNTSKAT
jgi:hypothetical protein